MPPPLPILVLAGSDRQPGHVPGGLDRDDLLTGLKGAARLPSGRCLAGELVDRLRSCGRFASPLLFGPRRAYEGHVECEIVDVDGTLAETLARVREVLRSRFPLSEPAAAISCDILPTADEIRRLMEDGYDPHAGCGLWSQFVEAAPAEMGASAWKPSYRFLREAEGPLVDVYPGHLAIFRPAALRMRLLIHLLNLAYRQRNLSMGQRAWPMLTGGLGRLLLEDARNIVRLRPTALSVQVPFEVLRAYCRYRRKRLSVPAFADAVSRLFVAREFRRGRGGPSAVISVTRILSFGKDIDTRAELAEAAEGVEVYHGG
ncbi:MAG TPA: hypothetical protein VML55_01535 [Planctomycetaceae bacterium]|nr:hypothetical protein [Planctomycetaceae bacterium]